MISSSTLTAYPQHDGFRVRCSYIFDDGRVITRGPFEVSTVIAANERKALLEDEVRLHVAELDAEKAIENNSVAAHGEATGAQVKLGWLKKGFAETEAYRAYYYMRKVMPDLLALGRTNFQLASLLGTTVQVIEDLKIKWSYLSTNAAALEAYQSVQAGY